MLGLSLSKILFTILIVVAVWKAFTLVNRLAGERKAALKRQGSAARRAAGTAHAKRQATVELRPCPRCGAYVEPRAGCGCGARANH